MTSPRFATVCHSPHGPAAHACSCSTLRFSLQVNAREKLIGWYSTGPKIRPGDLHIDQLVRCYTPSPVMVIIDVKPKDLGIPTAAYYAVEEILEGKQQHWTFKHVPSEIGALEAEEVGVEHLLRDMKDTSISTLANRVTQKLSSLKGLAARLQEVESYLHNVQSCRVPVNHRIIYHLQDVFNLLPNVHVDKLAQAFAVKTNDMMLAIYVSSIIRAVVALHNLIDNKLQNKRKEAQADSEQPRIDPGKAQADREKQAEEAKHRIGDDEFKGGANKENPTNR